MCSPFCDSHSGEELRNRIANLSRVVRSSTVALSPACNFRIAKPDRSRPSRLCGLQSFEGAPKISAFMRFVGETRTIFRPGAARWALLFMDGFCETLRPTTGRKKQIPRLRAFGMTTPCMLRCSAGGFRERTSRFSGLRSPVDSTGAPTPDLGQGLRNDSTCMLRRSAGGSPANFGTNKKSRFLGRMRPFGTTNFMLFSARAW